MIGKHQRLDGAVGLDTVVPARERGEPPPLPVSAWSNVVPFVRPRSEAPPADSAPAILVSAGDRPAPGSGASESQARIPGLLALSLMVHAGLYALTNREPAPMASIGLEAISVELVLGANSPAGAATTPSRQETQSAPTEQQQTEPDRTEVQEQKPPDQMAAVPPEATPQTPPPEQQPETTPPQPQAQTPPEPAPLAEAPPEPTPEAPVIREPVKPEPVKEPPKVEPKPVPERTPPKPAARHETKVKPKPAPKHEAAREAPRGKTAKRADTPGPRANAANGVGAGRSQNNADYRGLVSAHLARYKRFPPEAQSQGAQGAAAVRFVISGSGGVTSVSLVRGTGVSALDQEAVAMVRRASPFPAPPDGRPVSFTVPVSYKMR